MQIAPLLNIGRGVAPRLGGGGAKTRGYTHQGARRENGPGRLCPPPPQRGV